MGGEIEPGCHGGRGGTREERRPRAGKGKEGKGREGKGRGDGAQRKEESEKKQNKPQ